MSELTQVEMGEIALKIVKSNNPPVVDEVKLRSGISHLVKYTAISEEKATNFLLFSLEEKELGEIALKLMTQKACLFQRKPRIIKGMAKVARGVGVSPETALQFAYQLVGNEGDFDDTILNERDFSFMVLPKV